MEYYFRVVTDDDNIVLVKAKDVFEAGRKVEEMLEETGRNMIGRVTIKIDIVEITRTDYEMIIE